MNADFHIKGKTIETERLILRPFKENDLEDFFEYAKVEGVGERAGWSHHKSIEETKKVLNMFIEEDKVFAITLKESGKVIGSFGIEKYGCEDKLTELNNYLGRELGFVLSKAYWGRGYMTEVCKKVIEYLFKELNYDFIICAYYNFNSQSKRVQEKCGFKPYLHVIRETAFNSNESTTLNLLLNPKKNIKLKEKTNLR